MVLFEHIGHSHTIRLEKSPESPDHEIDLLDLGNLIPDTRVNGVKCRGKPDKPVAVPIHKESAKRVVKANSLLDALLKILYISFLFKSKEMPDM